MIKPTVGIRRVAVQRDALEPRGAPLNDNPRVHPGAKTGVLIEVIGDNTVTHGDIAVDANPAFIRVVAVGALEGKPLDERRVILGAVHAQKDRGAVVTIDDGDAGAPRADELDALSIEIERASVGPRRDLDAIAIDGSVDRGLDRRVITWHGEGGGKRHALQREQHE